MLKHRTIRLLAMGAALALASAAWAQARGRSAERPAAAAAGAYDRIEPARLARTLQEHQMTEMLEELVRSSAGVEGKAILVQAKLGQAANTPDQQARDKLVDEAIAVQDEVLAAYKDARGDREKVRYFRSRLDRVVMEGVTKCLPYMERIEYFLEEPGDRAVVAKAADNAVKLLDGLIAQVDTTMADWNETNSDERLITGDLGAGATPGRVPLPRGLDPPVPGHLPARQGAPPRQHPRHRLRRRRRVRQRRGQLQRRQVPLAPA